MSLHLILARDSRVLVVCGPRHSTAPRLVPIDEPEASANGPRDETHTRGNPLWWPRAWAGTWEVSQEYHVVSIVTATAASFVPRDEPECRRPPRRQSLSRTSSAVAPCARRHSARLPKKSP